ncbi:hypothetical protein POSPLADRAFT_1048690 [Postia placenta MAD-698-R-SB12]|uniref:RNase III domain-containing protein n=1 Tax=Postia placenta MAD-698-R-SB12 TaxID=670580 RepID=A0A1X6MT59_9APHY|nr:hypothetical protein POSPLADRAFT_1048690 [Postia placenta MAD-698-R-SB12]OSX59353.1 hypothetical protein POSPLADRAFT_1048690 [Postia placenta MAD-698-R-SB12]
MAGVVVTDLGRRPEIPSGRPALSPQLGPEGLPPLPEIHSNTIRTQVFTHRSYFARPTHIFEDTPEDPSPDNEMLEHLGDTVLNLIVTDLIRSDYPYLRVGPSTKVRALVVGNPTLASISVRYQLPERLLMHPAQAITLKASTNIQGTAYIGGVYSDRGLQIIKPWLCPLFRPYIAEAYRHVRVQHGLSPDPTPPATPLSPGGGRPAPSHSSATIGHLSLFNQHLQQQGKTIEWVWRDSEGQGTRTTPIWVVQAIVGEDCVGRGRGSTKKAAKNEAAKEGLARLGINVSPPMGHIPISASSL